MATPVPSNAGFLSIDTNISKQFILPLSTDQIGRVITFKDSTGKAASGSIEIQTQGGDKFQDDTTSYFITQAYGSATFVSRSGYWVLSQGSQQILASTIVATEITAINSNVAFYMSSISAYTDNQKVQTTLLVADGTLTVNTTSVSPLPYNFILTTDGTKDIQTIYGFGETANWITRVASNDSRYSFYLNGNTYENLTLLSTGRMGVMTSSPQYSLDISGTAFVSTLKLSSLQMIDVVTNATNFLTTSSGVLLVNGAGISGGGGGGGDVTTTNLVSTVRGLGSVGYISSASLASSLVSTVNGLSIFGYISTAALRSTVAGLGQIYVSTSFMGRTFSSFFVSLASSFTTSSLVASNAIISSATISTMTATNATMCNLTVSTLTFDTGDGFIDFPDIRALSLSTFFINTSTVNVSGVVSTQVLEVSSIVGPSLLATSNLTSTTIGLGTTGYVSSLSLVSTTVGITTGYQTAGFLSTANLLDIVSTPFLNTSLTSTTGQLQSNIQAWSQYPTTSDITLSNGTGIVPANTNNSIQLKTNNLAILDVNGGWGNLNMGASLTMYTSSSLENYSMGFGALGTGSISSLVFIRGDGITSIPAPIYISSLYLGNFGGTVAGQLTTDGTATDLFWNGSKLNNQTGGGGVSAENLTSTTVGLGTLGYISTAGGGGGGAIDYVSAFTVSTGFLQTSTISSYVMECYGIIGTQLFNLGPDNMGITSLTDATINANSTLITTNAFHLTSSNDARFVITSNVIFDAEQATFSNIFCYSTISTYSMAVYGPNTLVVDGTANFKNNVTTQALFVSSINGGDFPSRYVCQGILSNNQSIPPSTDTVLPFFADFDSNNWLVNGNTSSAAFQPTIAGYYSITYQVWWNRANGPGQLNIQIRKNGNSIAISQHEINSTEGLSMNLTRMAYMNGSNDSVDFSVYTATSDLDQTVLYGSIADSPGTYFSAFLIR